MATQTKDRLSLELIESRVCDLASEQMGIRRSEVTPGSRLIEDLRCDSLDMIELMVSIEEEFDVSLPDASDDPVYKQVFTRAPFRLRDFAELVWLRWGSGRGPRKRGWTGQLDGCELFPQAGLTPFSQLGGRLETPGDGQHHRPLDANSAGITQYRRIADGMRCVLIPPATVTIGSNEAARPPDEQPSHVVRLDAFLIDAEPVSTTAYARFINSIGPVSIETLFDWFVPREGDRRRVHSPLERGPEGWRPIAGTELWPMMMVSWHGSNAYALWAHGKDWHRYKETSRFLPTEAQWEYASRGAEPRSYPWGDAEPLENLARVGRHRRGASYALLEMPIAAVNERLGVSPFGLHHMAGNVWQWCRDFYDPEFYATPEATQPNAFNAKDSGVRVERGGSWVGPAILARSSYRRARVPHALGRCLGFRCVCEELP